jgi:hypothetical protein
MFRFHHQSFQQRSCFQPLLPVAFNLMKTLTDVVCLDDLPVVILLGVAIHVILSPENSRV